MNFRDPGLILVKSFRGKTKSYFQVSSVSESEVDLKDIEHGSFFKFSRKQLEKYVIDGVLSISHKDDIPESFFITPVTKKSKASRTQKEEDYSSEMERRYQYVKAVIDSNIPAYTEKWLKPWLNQQAELLHDSKPPNWRTLARWMHNFVESGWKKSSLMPAHIKKGNRSRKVKSEVTYILNSVVRDHVKQYTRVNYTKAHREFLERVKKENQKRAKEGLEPLKPSCYQTTLFRFHN